ncbi:MAG: TonB-dependent receptor [Bradymonadia bacterium]
MKTLGPIALGVLMSWPGEVCAQSPVDPNTPETPLEIEIDDTGDDGAIVVIGGATSGPGRAPGGAIDRRTVQEDAGADLSEVLHEQPGLRVTRLGGLGAFSTLSIRGSTAEQVAIFLDGVPLNQASGGPVDLSTLPTAIVGEVVIHRHVAPIGYGVSALGGVVDVKSRVPKGRDVEMVVGGGSFGTHSAQAWLAEGERGRAWGIALDHRGTQGDFEYVDDQGTLLGAEGDDVRRTRDHNRSALTSALINGRLQWGELSIKALTLLQSRSVELPGLGSIPAEEARLKSWRGLVGAQGALWLDPMLVTVSPYLTVSRTQLKDPLSEVGLSPDDTRDDTFATGATADLTADVAWGSWQLSPQVVFAGRYESFEPESANPALGRGQSTHRVRGSGAAGVTLTDEVWSWVAEGRYTQLRSSTAQGESVSDGQWTGRIGVRRELGDADHGLRLSVDGTRAVRFPDLFELFGNTGTVLGNPELKPERGWQGDLGAVYALSNSARDASLRLEAHGFVGRVDDLVQFERNSQGVLVARNVDTASLEGAEIGLWTRWGRHRGITVRGAFTWLDARSESVQVARDGKRLPLRPGRQVYGRLGWFDEGDAFWAWGLSAEIEHVGDNALDFANLIAVPDRTLYGAGAWVTAFRGQLRGDLTVRNLTDTQVVDLAGYPLPGVSVMAQITARPLLEAP